MNFHSITNVALRDIIFSSASIYAALKFICVQHEQTIKFPPHPMPLPHCYDTLYDTRFYIVMIVKNVRNECDICHILGFDIDICYKILYNI